MIVTGVTADEIRAAVAKVNAVEYGGNIVIERLDALNSKGTRHRFKLGTADSYAHGSRTSWTGRHGHWACWHVTRDILRELFNTQPTATVSTMYATYKGAEGFESTYPLTAWHNVGSAIAPASLPDLCVGHCNGDYY